MKNLIILISLFISTQIFAGPGAAGHSHGAPSVSKQKTMIIGSNHVRRLIKSGKIDKSWEKARHLESVKKKFGHKMEWVVSFQNDSGVKGKTLYIFLSTSGRFIAANFTGK